MTDWDPVDANTDDEDTEDDPKHTWGLRDGIIYLIEVSESMLDENESESSLLRTSLECCLTTLMNRIISSNDDQVGIVLFGTKNSPAPDGNYTFNPSVIPSNISVYMPLQEPSAENIKMLKSVKDSDDLRGFRDKYGVSKDFSIADALWTCTHLFSSSDRKLQSSTIVLFTNNDNPHNSDSHKTNQAMRKAMDLAQLHVDLDLIPMKGDFNGSIFYRELICTAMSLEADCFRLPEPTTTVERLLQRVIKRDHRHRCVARLKWTVGENMSLGVGVYNMCRPTMQPAKVWLERNTNTTVTSVQRYVRITTDEIGQKVEEGEMPHSEQRRVQEFGGEQIIFKPEEVKALKRMTEPGLKLLGFKPASVLLYEHHLKPSSFIYPNEDLIEGSSTLFSALLDRCADRNKIAICAFTPRRNVGPSFVALVPQKEEIGENDLQIKPPGFHLVFLPYAENIRALNISSNDGPLQPSNEEINLMTRIVKKLKFTYSPMDIENPKLQTIYSHIEALALDMDEPREIEDNTQPDLLMQGNLLEDLPAEFAKMFGQDEPSKGKKRAAGDNESSRSSKVSKTSSDGSGMSEVDILIMMNKVQSGEISKCTVKELKDFLKAKGVGGLTGKKKSELHELANQFK